MVRRLCPCSPWRSTGMQRSICSPCRNPCQRRWMPKGGCESGEAHSGESSWQDLWLSGEMSPSWSSLLLKDCTLWKRPTLEQYVKKCSPWEVTTLEKFAEDCSFGRDPTLEERKSMKNLSPEEEGAAETMSDELTTVPITHPLSLLGERR
ncbi:hypothetical protein HGM15179_007833 [Zosterops borbonicus]|uniref:Uncharacterized protein n=1 Tax=Zosterops borbonicus TaxID=364589 RepID=A0A8K1LMI4_9PASS|nr:hypothetical protein HGM15179_007833 [Zosterops borbonicus]